MKPGQIAGIIEDSSSEVRTDRLTRLLDFLGISWEILPIGSDLLTGDSNGALRRYHSILGPLPDAAAVWSSKALLVRHSFFFYATEDTAKSSSSLEGLTGCQNATLQSYGQESITAEVSTDWPSLTGSMHGLKVTAKVRSCDRVVTLETCGSISTIIGSNGGAAFLCCENGAHRAFVSCSCEIPDLDQPLTGKSYDVTRQFLSAVPLLMYLKWAFRDVCWQANESGACLILDDPVLKSRYGFCDFHLLDSQMKDHSFTTSIAMIPWNTRRTSVEMASLIRTSGGRLSVSVHGCDHTLREFETHDVSELNTRVESANRRMEQHRETTGISHDAIMIFPQGIFSPESMHVLQQHGFVAAVNTDPLPCEARQGLTLRDSWALAITRYSSFALFTRRYPADGLANFAFDILLGKPCLIVEHHNFFKAEHREVVGFVNALNSLNTTLRWRSLGDVIRRSYQWRIDSDGVVHVRMFANELFLTNDGDAEREYRIEKADQGSVGVEEVTADGRSVLWQNAGGSLFFGCTVPPGKEALIQVRYARPEKSSVPSEGINGSVKIAMRRRLREFRDNFLSRHDGLMAVAKRAKTIISSRQNLMARPERSSKDAGQAPVSVPASNADRAHVTPVETPLSFALITPAHNEAAFIEQTIRAVLDQSVLPRKWIIVSDGSTDGTDEIVQRYASQHDWIELLRMPERHDRQFAAKAHAFNAAYSRLTSVLCPPSSDNGFDLIGNLDADITFGPDYFDFLLSKFQLCPELGVAGTPFVEDHDRLDQHSYAHQFANSTHVSGACQMFRKECFEQVGGYVPVKAGAIDWVAVTTARMKGWQTRTFTEKVCFHHRKLGIGSGSPGKLPMWFHYGRKAYLVGGHPLWECSRGLFRMWQKPFVLGGLWFIAGYASAALLRKQRAVSRELMRFHRAEQMARLRGIFK